MNEIEKKHDVLLQYSEDLKELLLYVAGPHYEKSNIEWIPNAQKQVDYLNSEPGLPFEILKLIYDYRKTHTLSTEDNKKLSKYRNDAIIIMRNKHNWINAINLILRHSA